MSTIPQSGKWNPEEIRVRHIDLSELAVAAELVKPELQFMLPFMLAIYVITEWLGTKWLLRNMYLSPPGAPGYFAFDENFDDLSLERHRHRITQLGENLYNLQDVYGVIAPEEPFTPKDPRLKGEFVFMTKRLQTDRRNIEDTCLELEAMKLLWIWGIPFQLFHDGAGEGLNFDLHILLDENTPAFVEVKTCGTPTPSMTAIREQVKGAKKQLPAGKCGIVLLKIPEKWFEVKGSWRAEVRKTIDKCLRDTGRIASVIVNETHFALESDGCHSRGSVSEIPNFRSPYVGLLGEGIFRKRLAPTLNGWLPFDCITLEYLRARTSGPSPK